MNKCNIQTDENTRLHYEKEIKKLAQEILNLKIAKPALRALVNEGLYEIEDLRRYGLSKLSQLHGFGPKALDQIASLLKNH